MKYFELEVMMTMYSEKQNFHVQNIDNHGKTDARIGILVYAQDKELLSGSAFLLIDKKYSLKPSELYYMTIRLAVCEEKVSYIKLQNKILIQIGINNFADAVILDIKDIDD